MSSGKSGNGCSTVVGVVLVGLLAIGCITALVLPLLASAFGNVAGFAMGLVVWVLLLALVGLAASVSAVAIQHGICWGLRRGTHSLTPSQQVGWASMPAVLVALLVAFSAASMIAKKNGHQISNTPGAIAAAADGDSWSEILDRGIDRGGWGGARVGFWAGVVLGSIVFLWSNIGSISVAHDWAEQAYAMHNQPAATAGIGSGATSGGGGGSWQTVQPPPPPVPPQSSSQTQTPPPPPHQATSGPSAAAIRQVRDLVEVAGLDLDAIDLEIDQVTADLVDGLTWPKLADEFNRAVDISALAGQPIQATHDFVGHYRAIADEDSRELKEALKRDQDAANLLGEVKQKLESMKAPSDEIDEIESIYEDVGVLHLDLLPNREWADHRDALDALPDAIAELGCFQRAAHDMGFNDVADVTAEALKKSFRRLSALTHPDVNTGSGSQDQFTRVQYAKELLTDYLNTLGKTA